MYEELTSTNTRILKQHVIEIEEWYKKATLKEKEERSLWFIEQSINKALEECQTGLKIVVSCSFGIDSIVTLHLVQRVVSKLGLDIEVVWNNTLNEFPHTRKYAAKISEEWELTLIEARPTTTLRRVYEENGVDSLFKRKGDRSGGKPVVEKCCGSLKHTPMRRAIKENGWQLMFNGVRAGESRQRWMSARRDADLYYSKSEWKMWVSRPLLWWTSLGDSFNYGNAKQEDLWEYVRKYNIPYNPLYDLNAVIDENYAGNELIVDRETAEQLQEQGIRVFMPRTGCMACPIPIKRGYLKYLRITMPKVYRSMLFQLGFARVLLQEMDEEERENLLKEMSTFGVIDEETQNAVIEKLEEVLELRPCAFDNVGVK